MTTQGAAHTSDAQDDAQEIEAALAVLRRGAPEAMDRLLPLVYADLRRMAHRQLAAEPSGHTLSTTALVHEAYLRLVDRHARWEDRAQFFGVAAQAMRHILVDYARARHTAKRGGGVRPVSLDEAALVTSDRAAELVTFDEALARLALVDERLCRVVECRFFAGLSESETAEALGVSQRTVSRDWTTARGWLYRELRGDAA